MKAAAYSNSGAEASLFNEFSSAIGSKTGTAEKRVNRNQKMKRNI